MKLPVLIMLLLWCILPTAAIAANSMTYEEQLIKGDDRSPYLRILVKIKDGKMRRESRMEGGGTEVEVLNDTGRYNFFLEGDTATFTKKGDEWIDPTARQGRETVEFASAPEKFLQQIKGSGWTLNGTEIVSGHECQVYEMRASSTENQSIGMQKIWIWPERPYPPMKTLMSAGPLGAWTRQIIDMQLDAEIPDEDFLPPTNLQVHAWVPVGNAILAVTAEKLYEPGIELRKEFYDTGALHVITPIKNGKPNGVMRTFFATGVIDREETYRDGVLDGITKHYCGNGQQSVEWNFRNGKLNGPERQFNCDGKLTIEGQYVDGKKEGFSWTYDDNGKVVGWSLSRGGKSVDGKTYWPGVDKQQIELPQQ